MSAVSDILAFRIGIPADRIRMTPPPGTATKADLVELQSRKVGTHELIDGTLVRKPMGFREGRLAAIIIRFIEEHAESADAGVVVSPDGNIELSGGDILAPDVAFYLWERFPNRENPIEAIPEITPDLAVEVLSLSNTAAEMRHKREVYFASGTARVWELDPELRTINVYTDVDTFTTFTQDESVPGDPVLPGFVLSLPKLFARYDGRSRVVDPGERPA